MPFRTAVDPLLVGPLPPGRLTARRSLAVAAVLFVAATGGAYLAATYDRPVSASLFYLLGVMLIGAVAGLRLGLAAAILASLIYNFFLSEPVLQFSLGSADEYIPLIAFNISALLSGALAGRLNDRARAAEEATDRLNLLLEISSKLQEAVRPGEVGTALAEFCRSASLGRAEVFGVENGELLATTQDPATLPIASDALRHSSFGSVAPGLLVKPLSTFRGTVGLLVHESRVGRPHDNVDWSAIAVLLTIAIERCLLFRERSEKEALRRSEEFKSALISSISHDLRTPLAAITASATSLLAYEDRLDRGDRHSMLRIIQEQSERLNRFTANLLSLGRLQSEVGPGEIDKVDIAELLGTAIVAVRSGAGAAHIFDKAIAAPSVIVRGNAVMIEQIFINVLENAVRYSAAGTTVRIGLECDREQVEISVADEGPGISPVDLERVFDRFFRSSTSEGVEGQGLGLSIARGFAERFGGSIRAESPALADGGARIMIHFPLVEPTGERAQ